MPRLPAGQCFCGYCGAKPSTPCRTATGKATEYHAVRLRGGRHKDGSVHLSCWDVGFQAGLGGMGEARVKPFADSLLSPAACLEGWRIGVQVAQREYEKARRRYMNG